MIANFWPNFLKPLADKYYPQRVVSSFLLLLILVVQLTHLSLMFNVNKAIRLELGNSTFITFALIVLTVVLLFCVVYFGQFIYSRLLTIATVEATVIYILNLYHTTASDLKTSTILIVVTPFILFNKYKPSRVTLIIFSSVCFVLIDYWVQKNYPKIVDLHLGSQMILSFEIMVTIFISLFIVYSSLNQAEIQNSYRKVHKRLVTITNNMLPDFALKEIMSGRNQMAKRFESATVIIIDIVDFTKITKFYDPTRLVNFLSVIFNEFDKNCKQYKCEKIKTLGDGYLAVKGLHNETPTESVTQAVKFAFGLKHSLEKFNQVNKTKLALRVGINTGEIIGGVLGTSRLTFDIWGKTVNISSRLENNAETNCILMSEISYAYIRNIIPEAVERRVNIKGLGMASTYQIDLNKTPKGL